MTPEEFINCIRKDIIDRNMEIYSDSLKNISVNEITDEYWKNVCELYNAVGPDEKAVILQIFRQVTIDAIASILAVLDGGTVIDEFRGEFNLKYDNGEVLNGDLHDILLEHEYD